MKITPLDVARQDFPLSFRGYNRVEVDEFLTRLGSEYEQLVKENQNLKEEISFLGRKLEDFQAMEENLKGSLLLVQKLAEETRSNASREAAQILAEAVREAERRDMEAERQLAEITQLARRANAELRAMLGAHLEMLGQVEISGGAELPAS
ncbi:MAG: DivIVA domain-containing protein [Coprothermobacterota bacterium]|nr:DivIVA domain-containing protein [Coprothermobacterota bacterium]